MPDWWLDGRGTLLLMAAWIVVGVVGGLWMGFLLGMVSERILQAGEERIPPAMLAALAMPGDHAILERVLDRLLAAVVPAERELAETQTPGPGHDAEYEAPAQEVGDWTDPFFGLERPMVARLAPGQGIPGMATGGEGGEDGEGGQPMDPVEMWREKGAGAFDEWARDTMVPEGLEPGLGTMPWVEPIVMGDLPDDWTGEE